MQPFRTCFWTWIALFCIIFLNFKLFCIIFQTFELFCIIFPNLQTIFIIFLTFKLFFSEEHNPWNYLDSGKSTDHLYHRRKRGRTIFGLNNIWFAGNNLPQKKKRSYDIQSSYFQHLHHPFLESIIWVHFIYEHICWRRNKEHSLQQLSPTATSSSNLIFKWHLVWW